MKKSNFKFTNCARLVLSACSNQSEDDNDQNSHSSTHAPKKLKI